MYKIAAIEEANFPGLYFISEILYINNKIHYLVKIGQAKNIKNRMATYNTHNTAYHNFYNSAIEIVDDEERNKYENLAHQRLLMLRVYNAKKCAEWFYVSEYVYNNLITNPWKIIFDENFYNQLYNAPETKIRYKEIKQKDEESSKKLEQSSEELEHMINLLKIKDETIQTLTRTIEIYKEEKERDINNFDLYLNAYNLMRQYQNELQQYKKNHTTFIEVTEPKKRKTIFSFLKRR